MVMHALKSVFINKPRWCIGALLLVALNLAQAAIPDPVTASFSQVLHARSDKLAVWRYVDNPNIYVFDFAGLTQQGRTFNRVTQFTEQQTSEPYPRVLNDQEMAIYLKAARRTESDFAFGHDVMVHELVQFFNFAKRDKVALTEDETALREFLLAQGLMRDWRGFLQSVQPNVVILSIPQTQDKKAGEPLINIHARYAILLHEMSHGEFYTNAYYAAYVQKFWTESLTDVQKEAFKKFLAQYSYGMGVELLIVNEMQAYLMFTPDPHSFSARKLGVSDADLEAMRAAFRKGKPPTKLPLYWDLGG
jgi:hypothetical protein